MSQRLNVELINLPRRPGDSPWLLYKDVVRVEELVRGCDITLSLRFLSLRLLLDDVVFFLLFDFSYRRTDRLPGNRRGTDASALG